MRELLRELRARSRSRQAGQIIVLFAVFVIVLMVLAGSAFDYASIVVDNAKLQNSVDAAALAGADSLTSNETQPSQTQAAIAQATTVAYLNVNHVDSTNSSISITPVPYVPGAGTPTPASTIYNGISVSVTRQHPTAFWPLVGINNVTLRDAGSAQSARSMMDIMLSLDTTGSLVMTGDLTDTTSHQTGTTIQNAVLNFVQQLAPNQNDPLGPKIGIARYAGVKCTWVDTDHDGIMDLYTNAPPPASEYQQPCTDDETVLTPLTNNATSLSQIAQGPATGCPANAAEACPIQHHPYIVAPSFTLHNCGLPYGCSQSNAPYYTGTKEPNALCVVNPTDSLCTETPATVQSTGFAWSTVNGGRNGTGNAQARRVLVIMTDGQDEAWPTDGAAPGSTDYAFPESIATYDRNFVQLATDLKAPNPGGVSGPGVEIYVVGYFCNTNPSTYTTGQYPPFNFCESELAYSAAPRACPGPPGGTIPPSNQLSPIDQLLIQVSSSSPGTCDHYIPLSKSESLPDLFTALAGTISRGQLTQ